MFEAYKRYFDFEGRAGRKEYWLFYLLFVIVSVASSVLVFVTGGDGVASMLISAIYAIFCLGSFIPSLAVSFRRLHDTGRSAWWLLIALLPFVGGIVLLVFTVLPSTPAANRFGPPPGSTALEATFA